MALTFCSKKLLPTKKLKIDWDGMGWDGKQRVVFKQSVPKDYEPKDFIIQY
jgi:hypothetical protein